MQLSRLGFAILLAASAVTLSPTLVKADIPNGSSVQGWLINYSAPVQESVSLTDLNTLNDTSALHLQKFASFDAPVSPVTITFTRPSSTSAPGSIILEEENVFTGVGLSSFYFQLTGGATFDTASSSALNINPFTTRDYADGNSLLTVSGGVLNGNSVWSPGTTSGALYITVPASTLSFTLVEGVPEGGILPEPASLAFGLIPAVALLRRRR